MFLKKYIYPLALFIALLSVTSSMGQTSHNSNSKTNFAQIWSETPAVMMPAFNLEAAKKNAHELRHEAHLFAKDFFTNLNFNTAGNWTTENSQRVWRLVIRSKGALSLNLMLNKFELAPGASLTVYNKDRSKQAGPFTAEYNSEAQKLPIQPVEGSEILVEFIEPLNAKASSFNIFKVNHDFAGFFKQLEKSDIGNSGDCHVNVNCSEGNAWKNERRSVVKIVNRFGTAWCSGALINNENRDATPYVLTANHCTCSQDVETVLFYFNFEYPGCSDQGWVNEYMVMHGAQQVANAIRSDFSLLQLKTQVPSSFRPYFAGWSRQSSNLPSGVGIHHPRGDVKKISTFSVPATNAACLDGTRTFCGVEEYLANADYWRVRWSLTTNGFGVVEPVSSGSPLFNDKHQIVGQLYGVCNQDGGTDCEAAAERPAMYGKLSASWNNGSSRDGLNDWLSPNQNRFNLGGHSPKGWRHATMGTSENVKAAVRSIVINEGQVFYRNDDNRILNYYWTNDQWNAGVVSQPEQWKRVHGDLVTNGTGHLFYRGPNGRIQCYYYNGGWQHGIVDDGPQNFPVSNEPGSLIVGSNSKIYYRGTDDFIHSFEWMNGDWVHEYVSNTNNPNEKCAGDVIVNTAGTQPFYRGADGKLHTYWDSGSGWLHVNLDNSGSSAWEIAWNPGSMDFLDGKVIYRGADDNIQMFLYNNGWQHEWVSHTWGPSEPCGGVVTVSDQGIIYYQGWDGKMHQYTWNTTNNNWDPGFVEGSYEAPYQHSVDYAIEVLPNGQIFYRGSDDHKLHSYFYDNTGFKSETVEEPIAAQSAATLLKLYPNPTEGQLNLELSSAYASTGTVTVINHLGQVVMQSTFAAETTKTRLDVSTLTNGLYFFQLQVAGRKPITEKVLIQH